VRVSRGPALRGALAGRVAALSLALLLPPAAYTQVVPDRASPFSAVRWEGDEPLVRFDGTWYHLVSLDGLSKADIIAYARRTYDDRWQKRFSEDLVELLKGMGHAPGAEVRLVLSLEGRMSEHTGRMTEENRQDVLRYNQRAEGRLAEQTPSRPAPALSVESGRATPAQRRLAEQFAAHMDRIWDQAPAAGKANLRFLLRRGGQPFAGEVSIHTEFGFSANARGRHRTQGFNPNANGRWVYEDLDPGTYSLEP